MKRIDESFAFRKPVKIDLIGTEISPTGYIHQKGVERDWTKYIHKNIAQECQLVTAINAYYFLTGKTITQDSILYNKYRILCKAIAGTAICIEKVYEKLNIKLTNKYAWLFDDGKFIAKLPLEVSIWHKSYGYHSACVVDYEPITESVRLTNAKNITNLNGWIYMEDLVHYIVWQGDDGIVSDINIIGRDVWKFRAFEYKKYDNI